MNTAEASKVCIVYAVPRHCTPLLHDVQYTSAAGVLEADIVDDWDAPVDHEAVGDEV